MRKIALMLALALASSAALADTYNVGTRLIADGDGAGKVIELLGKPDLVTPIHNQYGAQIGEKWTYFRDGKTVVFTISPNGRVMGIIESR